MTADWMNPDGIGLGLLHAVEGTSRLAATSFVSGLWQGLVLAVTAAICLRFVPKATAAVRFAIWTGVFAVLALLPLVHAYSLRGTGEAGHAAVQLDVRWSFAIAAFWLVGSLIRAIELAAGAVRLRAIWKKATPVGASTSLGGVLTAGRRKVQICTSADVDRPSVIGFFSPRILIPEELYGRLTEVELEQIVLHEMGHLRRGDDWMNLLQKISLVLVPLNPVLIWIERRLCLERELACDDRVLRLTNAPKAYATCLANLAEHRMSRRAAALSLGAWERRPELARRVHSILRRGEGMGRTQARVVVGVLTMVLLGGAAELARCPQLVSFSGAASTASQLSMGRETAAGGYQPVLFRAGNVGNVGRRAHETLLKATVPVAREALPVSSTAPKRHRSAPSAMLVRSRQSRATVRQTQRMVVLTSWVGSGMDSGAKPARSQGVVFSVTEQVFASSYAAVPTPDGWLVFQL